MNEPADRRPLTSRNTAWARMLAGWLTRRGVTPNAISIASTGCAAIAGAALYISHFTPDGGVDGAQRVVVLLAALAFVQLRLLCNLFDGMVAIEGGKQTRNGAFWNEFPDRIADILILAGAGYGVGAPALGWAAAAMAVLTAYVRELGAHIGLKPDFSGPMAKPHRMAALTTGMVVALFEPLWLWRGESITIALWVIAIGAALTALRRARNILVQLRA